MDEELKCDNLFGTNFNPATMNKTQLTHINIGR